MKSKSLIKAGLGLLAGMMFMASSAMPALAYDGSGDDTTIKSEDVYKKYVDSANKDKDDSVNPALDVDWDISINPNVKGEGILTPEGNLTLVDDIDEAHSEALQYMTVQTKNGNIFYLIVDRSGDEDNVYFLNMVDESDLMALMDEETQEKFNEAINPSVKEEEKKDDSTVLFSNQDTKDDTDVKDAEKEIIKETSSNPVGMFIVFIIIGAVVAGGYYFFKIKPEREKPDVDEDIEFYDDEDYVDEDTIVEEVDHDTLVDGHELDDSSDSDLAVDDFSDESVDE